VVSSIARVARRMDAARTGPICVIVALLTLSISVWFATGLGTASAAPHPPWLLGVLFVAFLVAESTLLHIEFRKQALSISLSEIPLVVGLFLVSPAALVGVRVLAVVAVAVWQRRSLTKSVFNVTLAAAEVVVVEAIFTSFGSADVTSPMSWLAVLAAVVAGGALGVCSIQAVIRLSQGRQRLAGGVGRLVLVPAIGITNSIAALVILLVLHANVWAGFLLGVLCGMLVLAYRGYAGSQRQHASLRQVLGFSRLIELIR